MSVAIRLSGLSKTYRKGWNRVAVNAVRNVSLEVAQGEAFGFVGPNGAGKSSTIRILMGLSIADSGIAEIFGVSVARHEARRRLGYVPESPYLYDYLTPTEILEMGLGLHRVSVGDRRRHVAEWLDRLGLSAVAHAPIRSFSKGMTQRVAIAQALAIQPRVMILDEPLSGLDPIGRVEVTDLLAEYKRSGGTLFFTSHVLHDVERLADRFGLISGGELRSVRSPGELLGQKDVVQVRSAGAEAPPGMVREGLETWVGSFPRSELWAMMGTLEGLGHQLIEVRPSVSLEAAFMQSVEKERRDGSPDK